MADAPSGGSSWGAFEIILVLILAIGFLTQLQNGFKSPAAQTPIKDTTTSTPAQLPCGLSINRPHSLEKVTTFVTLIGQTSGCEWRATDTVTLYAQVIDTYGRPVSAYTTIPRTGDVLQETIPFTVSIPLNTTPTTTKGFLLLVPARNTAQHTASYRIPITFSR